MTTDDKWIDDLVKEFAPHYGHQYCTEICPAYRLRATIQAKLKEARVDALRIVKQRLPSPDNNVEEWKGHNLGLSQALIVVDLEIDRLLDQQKKGS